MAVALALLVHALLLLPLLLADHAPRDTGPVLQFVSLWPEPPPPEPVAPPPLPAPSPPAAPRAQPALVPLAITPEPDSPPATPDPEPAAPPRVVDWNAEARAAADRFMTRQDDAPTTFSPPPQPLREPCKPKESSFKWNPEEPRAGLLPLPFVRIGERCIVGLGFFACTLGELPPPNDKLFDDMKKGGESPSSVPDPHHCD